MANIVDRTIGNEIRRVQSEVRRSVNDAKEQAQEMVGEIKQDLEKTYREGRRFIDQVTRNQLTDIAQSSTEDGVDPKELVEDIESREDLEAIEQTEGREMAFPLFVFGAAVVIDVFDVFGLAAPGSMTFVNLFFSIYLYFWFKGKIDESFVENSQNIAGSTRRVRRYRGAYRALANTGVGKRFAAKFGERFAKRVLLKRFWRYAIGSLIFIVQIFVLQSLFVIIVWKQQTKMVKAYMSFVEKISNLLNTMDNIENNLVDTLEAKSLGGR